MSPNDYIRHLLQMRRQNADLRKQAQIKEFTAWSQTAVVITDVESEDWEMTNSPRVSKKNTKKNQQFVKKLDVTGVQSESGEEVYIDHMDPQYKRQISMVKDPNNTIPHKEPEYLDGRGEHRISDLGYAKIADRQGDLKTDVYLAPYDPNWKRSEDMMQQVIKHWIANHGNPERIMPEPDATMFVGIKEAWDDFVSKILSERVEDK